MPSSHRSIESVIYLRVYMHLPAITPQVFRYSRIFAFLARELIRVPQVRVWKIIVNILVDFAIPLQICFLNLIFIGI